MCTTSIIKISGQTSAQGILHLRNPNLGPNSGKRVLDARILEPNSWVEFFDSAFFQQKRPPEKFTLQKFTSQNSPSKIQPRKSGQKIHIAPLQGHLSRAAKRGGFKRGGFPIWTCPSFFVLFCPFWDFPDFSGIFLICSGMVRGFSRIVLFLFLGLLRAPTRNSPERVRDTIWTFPEKSGKHPGLETPRFSFSQIWLKK